MNVEFKYSTVIYACANGIRSMIYNGEEKMCHICLLN